MISLQLGTSKILFPEVNFNLISGKNTLGCTFSVINFKSIISKIIPKKKGELVHVVISDKTRLCEYPMYLPKLVQYLLDLGYQHKNIVFYIAYGTHAKQSDEESIAAYGETYLQYRFIHHDCMQEDIFHDFGTTARGTHVTIRKDVFECDLLITFGAISHHYFAGFGGGRKLLFPGLAQKSAVYHNHSLFLDFEKHRLHPGCQSAQLQGNPVAEDLKEIDQMLPEKISIHGVLDEHGKLVQIFCGKDYQTFLDACEFYTGLYGISTPHKYDTVLASCGGNPKDINFIQAHKSIHNAAAFVKDGGTLIIFAECRDGIGNDSFLDFFTYKNKSNLYKYLRTNYSGNAGTALSMMEKAERISILIVTILSEKVCEAMGIKKTSTSDTSIYLAGKENEVGIIQNASLCFKPRNNWFAKK